MLKLDFYRIVGANIIFDVEQELGDVDGFSLLPETAVISGTEVTMRVEDIFEIDQSVL